MALAFWRVLTLSIDKVQKRAAILWFGVQIALNAFWSVAFFGMHSPTLGLIVIALLTVAIVATIWAFVRIDRLAGLILLPYLGWVLFATALNGSIYLLNR